MPRPFREFTLKVLIVLSLFFFLAKLQAHESHDYQLANGLTCTCVSDPNLAFSAVGMQVNVGTWHDPKAYPGMAHLVEHLIFTCAKASNGESWDALIARYGGESSGFTEAGRTCFSFSVVHQGLPITLKTFLSSCMRLKCCEEALASECEIIREEANFVWQTDSARLRRMLQLHASPNHPFAQYGMGDVKALMQLTPEKILGWHAYYYRPKNMHLMIVSALPLAEFESLLQQVCGEEVNEITPTLDETLTPYAHDKAFAQEKWQSQISFTESAAGSYHLMLAWEVVPEIAKSCLPLLHALAGLLGEEGEGSLYAEYAEKGWALGCDSGVLVLPSGGAVLSCTWELTDKGFKHDTEIVQGIMSALKRWNIDGIPLYYLEERQKQRQLAASLGEVKSAKQRVLQRLSQEEDKTSESFSSLKWKAVCAQICPETVHIVKLAPKKDLKIALEQYDPLTQCFFGTCAFSKQQSQKWLKAQVSAVKRTPPPNSWMPHQLPQGALEASDALSLSNLWQNQGECGALALLPLPQDSPCAAWRLRWKLGAVHSAEERVYRDLTLEILRLGLRRSEDTLKRAGIVAALSEEEGALCIDVSGYPERLLDYLSTWVDLLSDIAISPAHFQLAKQQLLSLVQKQTRSGQVAPMTLLDQAFQQQLDPVEQTRLLKKLTLELFQPLATQGLKAESVDLIGVSSTPKEKVLQWWNALQSRIEPIEAEKTSVFDLNEQVGPFALDRRVSLDEHQLVWMAACPKSCQETALEMVCSSLKEFLFLALRTETQLVYCLDVELIPYRDTRFLVCRMHSSKAAPQELLLCLERALERFLEKDALSLERFQMQRQAYVQSLKALPATPQAVCLWISEAMHRYGKDMEYKKHKAECCMALSLNDYQREIKTLLGTQNRKRIAFLFTGRPAKEALTYSTVRSWKVLWKKLGSCS